jgi:hypothetical protein
MLTLFLGLLASPLVLAHDQKEYTVILGSEGAMPDSIAAGVLVETDSIFFRNHDSRDEARHRVLVDADDDGAFEGIDDFDTGWMVTSCELNETGHKVDDNFQTAAMVLLAPESGLLPGNVSMMHQVELEGELTDTPFYALYSVDDHTMPNGPVTPGPEDELESGTDDSILRAVIISAGAIALVLVSRLTNPSRDE